MGLTSRDQSANDGCAPGDLPEARPVEVPLAEQLEVLAATWECEPPGLHRSQHLHREVCVACSHADALRATLARQAAGTSGGDADLRLRTALADAGAAIEDMPWDERFARVDESLTALGVHPGAGKARTFLVGVFVSAHAQRQTDERCSVDSARHNHVTRDIKPPGECPACDRYHARNAQP